VELGVGWDGKFLGGCGVAAPPVPVEWILFEEGIRVERVVYPDETAGESWWEAGVGTIAVARSLAPGRLRFTLAHEFGHLALRHHERQFGDLSDPRPRLRDGPELAWEPP